MARRWLLGAVGALMLLLAGRAEAQGIGAGVSWYSGSPETYWIWSIGTSRRLSSALSTTVSASWWSPENDGGGDLVGLGLDLSLWRGGNPGLYVVGGLGGGFGFNGADVFYGNYSIGLGYDFRLFKAVGLGAEARWVGLTQGGNEGVQVGVRLGGGMRRKTAAATTPPPSSTTTTSSTASAPPPGVPGTPLAMSVVETALGVMGTPYAWGGTSANGFDCSGLIQYAFGAHGVTLPRTSADQAKQGVAVDKSLAALAPGDILTFSSGAGGSTVSHVGLYLGGGEFIHSATNGVQKSVLSATDPYGKWWYARWVGARRVVGA
ncbi:MAG: C40 family peptidase [Gemmatimonadales bacterium]